MKFKIGDTVKETKGFKQTGVVLEAEKDKTWATGERYLITFGFKDGNVMSDGNGFKKILESLEKLPPFK